MQESRMAAELYFRTFRRSPAIIYGPGVTSAAAVLQVVTPAGGNPPGQDQCPSAALQATSLELRWLRSISWTSSSEILVNVTFRKVLEMLHRRSRRARSRTTSTSPMEAAPNPFFPSCRLSHDLLPERPDRRQEEAHPRAGRAPHHHPGVRGPHAQGHRRIRRRPPAGERLSA